MFALGQRQGGAEAGKAAADDGDLRVDRARQGRTGRSRRRLQLVVLRQSSTPADRLSRVPASRTLAAFCEEVSDAAIVDVEPAQPQRVRVRARRRARLAPPELTDRRAKPAVYFGGKARIIDFALSNG